MKILQVPYANKIPLFSKAGTIPGGLEKVIHNVHKLLLSRGYDCHVIDAEGSYWDAPNVHKIMTESPIETNKIPIIASLVETRFGAVNKPTAHVKITNDITLGFINLNNSEKLNRSSWDKLLFFNFELSISFF